ncbi:uncharacterized protein LOC133733862 [Rosa rugosa]|uniref:uncharacterized protein LOC133733862 n=1 Tax=Rosa rugosa TaxID=74645 RepID=UPI002B40648A|nr:uncharacterized protein LOC133733862 [Rosa rugosa]
MQTQPSVDDSHVNLDKDVDEVTADVTPNHLMRHQGRKAMKEAIQRKGKTKDPNPNPHLTFAAEIMATNQKELSAKEKRDEEFVRHRQDQQLEYIRLQIDIRNEAFKIQEREYRIMEREDRIREREDRIMQMDTSKMTPTKKKYWQRKQKKIAEREDDGSGGSNFQTHFLSGYPQPHFTGGYYPQPPFAGAFTQSPLTGRLQQPHFTGGYYPQPHFVGAFPQPPLTGGFPPPTLIGGYYPQPPFLPQPHLSHFSTDESTNLNPNDEHSSTN